MSVAAARYIELDTDPGPNDTTGAAASRPRWDAALELNLSYQVLILDFFPALLCNSASFTFNVLMRCRTGLGKRSG